MAVSTTFTSEVLTTHAAADVLFIFELVAKQVVEVTEIFIAKPTVVVGILFVRFQFLRFHKAKGTVIVSAWELAG